VIDSAFISSSIWITEGYHKTTIIPIRPGGNRHLNDAVPQFEVVAKLLQRIGRGPMLEFGLFDTACKIFNRRPEGQLDLAPAHAQHDLPSAAAVARAVCRDIRSIDRLQIRQ
jgi:hypothetical protein